MEKFSVSDVLWIGAAITCFCVWIVSLRRRVR